MKRKRYADEQIAFALRQAENGTSVEEVCRKLGVSEATFYRWKKQFAGMGVVEIRRLKDLAAARVRYGYRRLHVLLRREGWSVNHKRVYRLYRRPVDPHQAAPAQARLALPSRAARDRRAQRHLGHGLHV